MSTPSSSRRPSDRPILAIVLRLLAMAAISTMFMLVKLASEAGVALPELVFWRQFISVPLLLCWLLATRRVGLLATRRMGSHAIRATTGTAGLCCNLGAATLLPLPVQTTLGFSAPLFAVLITGLILREKVGPWRWTAVMLGFAGVLVVAQPGGTHVAPLGLALGLASGVLVSIISFQIRDLSRTEAPVACVFWFASCSALFGATLMPIYAKPHDLHVWLLLIAIGLTGTVAQLLLTAALRYGQVATVVVMDYTALIWATLYGWSIWGTLPPAATWLGAPLIVAAGLVITWREHYLSRRISSTSSLDEGAMEEAADEAQAMARKGT